MALPEIIKDIDARVKIAGDTMTGNLKGQWFQGTWLQTSQVADLGKSPSRIAVIRDDGWLYYRTPSELASDIGLTGNYVRSFYETDDYFDLFTDNNLVGINYCGAGTGGYFYIGREWGKNSDGNNFGMQLRFSGWNGQLCTRSFNGWGAQWSDWLTYLNNTNFGNYALPLTGGTLTGQLMFNNNTSNQNGYPSIRWGAIQSNTPFIGYATDQSDGTFIITSLKGTSYATGLAIGGSSQNLLYKGQIVLNASNFNQYAPSLTGSGVSGTWGISISGNAASATKATQDGDGAVISSTYLKLSGGTMTGTIFHTGESTGRRIITGNLRNAGIKYDYSGRESLIISAGTYSNAGISFYTANELNMNDGNGQWNTVSPSVHILKKSLAINYNLTEDPTYNLYVNGTSYFTGTVIATMFKGDTSVAGILPQQSNEINFSSNGSIIWFGYRTPAGSSAVSTYNFGNSSGSATGTIKAGAVYGGVWNDYAEYRESDIAQPGKCIIENGDDTLRLSTERLQRGAEIVSDTFGFAIGETDICKTPIAASGRVLAYGYEDREQFKSHIGYPVCSGPNGTVSIMTDEEEQLYPSRIIGYISAVPDYEIWGTGNVKVDGRIWIRIK